MKTNVAVQIKEEGGIRSLLINIHIYLYLYKYENVYLSVCLFVHVFLGYFQTDCEAGGRTIAEGHSAIRRRTLRLLT